MGELDAAGTADRAVGLEPYTLWQLIGYALWLGTLGFGGPVALVGYMRRDLVERRHWIPETAYNQGLALAELAPGPLAAQLAMYLGYVRFRFIGAALVGLAFTLPSFLMVVGLGWAYIHFGGLPWIHAVFYGVGACVIGLIAHSAYRLTVRTVGRDWLLWAIYLVLAAATILTASEPVLLVLVAGVIAWLVEAPPTLTNLTTRKRLRAIGSRATTLWGITVGPLAMATPDVSWSVLWSLFSFFIEAGAFVFGSGLAIIPFLYGGVVQQHHWLTNQQFLDAVSVALLTPGPVVITSGFIGFLVAGLPGACVAALATFLPAYVFTIGLAPVLKRFGTHPGVAAFVRGVTAAAIGAITGSVFILGRQSIVDGLTALVAVATFVLLWRVKRVPEPALVLAAALIGLLAFPLIHR